MTLKQWAQDWANSSPRAYACIWVTFWNFMASSCSSILYGWNIWVDPIYHAFYGNAPRTFARGAPVFAFATMILFMGLINSLIMGPYNWGSSQTRICGIKLGARKCFIAGVLLMAIGGCLQGVATRYQSIALLFIGSGLFFGCGAGLVFPVVRSVPMLFFAAPSVNLRGLGAGITGSAPGLWAASFSFWGLAISAAVGIADTFYIAVGIFSVLSVIPLPFINVTAPAVSPTNSASLSPKSKLDKALAEVPLLSYRQVLGTSQFWFFNIAMLLVMSPAFGIKYCKFEIYHLHNVMMRICENILLQQWLHFTQSLFLISALL